MLNMKKLLGVSALIAVLAACNGGGEAAAPAPSVPEAASAAASQVLPNEQPESASMASGHYEGDGHNHSQNHDKDHSAMNALDWDGVYQGKLPCADCEQIATTVELKQDGTFRYVADYQGGKEALKVEKQGKFKWEDNGSVVELQMDGEDNLRFFVAEGHLQQLSKGQSEYQPDGLYNLPKQ